MRLKTCLTTAAAAVTLLLAGCSNVTTDAGRIPDAGAAERTVVFSVENIPTDYDAMIRAAQTDASRALFSILPNQPFQPNSPHLVFMLQGKANNGASLPNTVITLTGAAPYTFQQNLQAALWDLTLTAYKEASAGTADTAQPVLRGHCTADLSNGSAQVTFNMSTRNLTTPGTVKITGDVKDTDGICKHYEIGMYHANTGKLVEKYTKPAGGTENTNAKQDYDAAPSGGQFDFHYGDDSLPTPDQKVTLNAGAYEFRMIFYKGAAPNWIPVGSYSDIIVVNPGNDLVQTLHIGDVMNKKPTAPEDLRAYLVDNTEDTEGRYYQVKLTWKKAKFETNYEVELTTYPDDGTAANPPKEVYGFKETMDALTTKEWGTSPVRYAGSLGWATEECTLKLELGKVYEVQVRARNYIGESPWCARGVTAVSPPGTPSAGCTLFATSGKHINRLRIKYDLNGGELTLNPAPTPSPPMPIKNQYIAYDSDDSSAPKPLLAISTASPPSGNTLIKTVGTPSAQLNFVKWLDSNTGIAAATTYTYKNVYVTADFGAGLDGTVTVPTLTDMPSNAVTIKYADHTGAPAQTSTANTTGHHEIPKYVAANTVTWITVEFASPSPPPTDTYSDMECSIYFANGSGAYSKIDLTPAPDGKSCTFSTGLYAPQTFTLSVKAKNQHGATLGKTYLIDLY